MNKLTLIFAIVSICGIVQNVSACEGKTVIYEDNFANDTGGWVLLPSMVDVEKSSLVINAAAKTNQKTLNFVNPIPAGDICTDVVFGDNHPETAAGLLVWGQDFSNFFVLQIRHQGSVGIWRMQDNKWLPLIQDRADSSVKKGNAELNRLRIRATETSLSFFVNNAKIREVRGRPPQVAWYFGVYGAGEKEPATVLFKNFRVTTLE